MTDRTLNPEDARNAAREVGKCRLQAFLFVVPLLVFIFFAFVAPISSMMFRSIHDPTVAELVPETLVVLKDWSGDTVPDDTILTVFAAELKILAAARESGRLASEINRIAPGMSSTINSTARTMRRADDAEIAANGATLLLEAHERWSAPATWRAIKTAGASYSAGYYLTSLDLERDAEGAIVARDTQIYVQLYIKTLRIALVITILTMLLGYPLAFYMAHTSDARANFLIVFLLLPFWTSLLVRTTAWIALLQTGGVVNSTLMSIGIINEPLDLLYTEFSTIISMTHILLPFMVLPLYAVMRGIDGSFMRAAISMGSSPVAAWCRIYLPMSLPGLSAGALLVFDISVGYYMWAITSRPPWLVAPTGR